MHLLLSNDDGVDAEGLKRLRDALRTARPDWRITVVAPTTERSATSHALTLTQPLRIEERGDDVFAVSGTPTDSVLVAMNSIVAEDPPDVVISGINHGPNMGEDVHYSGTVAAAFEGRMLDVPAVALSLASREIPLRFGAAAHFAGEILPTWIEEGLVPDTLLNVNIPGGEPHEVKGIRACRLGSRKYTDVVVRKEDPRGRAYYWIAGHHQAISEEPNTDLVLSADGWITVTPLLVDLTDHRKLDQLGGIDQTW